MTGCPVKPELKIIRFLIVGLANLFITYGLFFTLVNLGLNYRWSLLFSSVTGIFISASANSRFTFQQKSLTHLIYFLGVYLITVSGNYITLDYGVTQLEISPEKVQFFLVIPFAALTYLLLLVGDIIHKRHHT